MPPKTTKGKNNGKVEGAPAVGDANAASTASGRSSDASWMRMYENLKQFQEEHGHLDVSGEGTSKDQGLIRWVARQRGNYQSGSPNSIPAHRKQLLDDLGFVWIPQSKTKSNSKPPPPPAPPLSVGTKRDATSEAKNATEDKATDVTSKADEDQENFAKLAPDKDKAASTHLKNNAPAKPDISKVAIQDSGGPTTDVKADKDSTTQAVGTGQNDSSEGLDRDKAPDDSNNCGEVIDEDATASDSDEDSKKCNSSEWKRKRWMKYYRLLLLHQKKWETLEVRKEDNKKLFIWLSQQREGFNQGTLEEEKRKLLEETGFNWNETNKNQSNESAGVKARSEKENDISTAEAPQKAEAKESEQEDTGGTVLPAVKVDPEILALNEFLPLKKASALKNKQWHEGYEKCKIYLAKYGTTFVTKERMDEFKGLHNWTYRQRRLLWEYELSRDRKELLDKIGFDFGAPAIASANMVKEKASAETLELQQALEEGNYHRKRKRTVAFSDDVQASDHVHVEPREEPKNGSKKEATQTPSQRGNNSSDEDSDASNEDQVSKSHSSKREQAVYVKMWLNKCAELKAYKKKHGTTNIHHSDVTSRGLYHWARRQRLAYKKKELPKDRIKKLEKIGFQWDLQKSGSDDSNDEESNDSSSDDDAARPKKRKHSSVSSKTTATGKSKQGGNTKQGKSDNAARVREGKAKRTPSSDSSSDDSSISQSSRGLDKFQKRWLHMFRELKKFRRHHGTYEVTYSDIKHRHLYHWIRRQRQRYHENDLPEDREAVLNEHGFDWNSDGHEEKKNTDDDDSTEDQEESTDDDTIEERKSEAKSHRRREADDEKWMQAFKDLQLYKKKHGTFQISYSNLEKRYLYYWTWRQRKIFRLNEMPRDRIKLLQSIGFDFDGGKSSGAKSVTIVAPGKRQARRPSDGSESSSTTSDDDGSSGRTAYAHKNPKKKTSRSSQRIPVAVGKVEDMENYLEQVEREIEEKEDELSSLRSVASRVKSLLSQAKAEAPGDL